MGHPGRQGLRNGGTLALTGSTLFLVRASESVMAETVSPRASCSESTTLGCDYRATFAKQIV